MPEESKSLSDDFLAPFHEAMASLIDLEQQVEVLSQIDGLDRDLSALANEYRHIFAIQVLRLGRIIERYERELQCETL